MHYYACMNVIFERAIVSFDDLFLKQQTIQSNALIITCKHCFKYLFKRTLRCNVYQTNVLYF